jgi:hypothetical protein
MYLGEETIKEMSAGYQSVRAKLNSLVEAYILRDFKNPRAREHASQGFPRRLKVMARCIDNVFQTIPPDRSDLPSRDELSDVTINIQSFVLTFRQHRQSRLDLGFRERAEPTRRHADPSQFQDLARLSARQRRHRRGRA